MCNHLNLKILIHIFTIIYLIIIMRGENFVAHLYGLDGTPVAHHWSRVLSSHPKVVFRSEGEIPATRGRRVSTDYCNTTSALIQPHK
jgi:hypothetical protein